MNKKEKENPDLKSTLGERYKKAIYELKTSDLYSVITIALWNLGEHLILKCFISFYIFVFYMASMSMKHLSFHALTLLIYEAEHFEWCLYSFILNFI